MTTNEMTRDLAITPLLAVYGTLTRGLWNSPMLGDAALVAEHDTVQGYRMRQSGPGVRGGIPAVFDAGPEQLVSVEVYDWSAIEDTALRQAQFARIDRMELGCGYERRLVTTTGGHRAWMYVMPTARASVFAYDVPSGNWRHPNPNNVRGHSDTGVQ